jgi:hypothetical protein
MAGDLDVTSIPLDVLPCEAFDFCRPNSAKSADDCQRQNACMGGEQEGAHLIRRENLDLLLRLLERIALLGSRLAVWMEVSLLLADR